MFGYEGVLFYKAQSSLSLASTNINKTNNLHSKLLAFPVGFEYKNEISDVVSNVKLITTNIAKLVRKASETKDLLCKNDAEFASGYYQSALSNYSGKETLNDSDEGFVNYYSSKYDEYLFKYLDEMNSQGNLPEEYRETYNQLKLKLEIKEYEKELEVLDKDSKKYKTKLSELNKKQEELNDMYISQLESKDNLTTEEQEILKNLKDSKSLNAKQAELEKLKKNIPVNPGNPNGRMTEQQGKNYVAAKKKYDDYMAKINKLEDEIEGLQKNLGVYENKWYEDIGEAFVKTGCAWKTAFKTKDLDDFKSAAKQTAATGAVICRSAGSGILKIGELVVDGVVVAGGSIVSGLAWIGNSDAGKNLMDGTLDFIKRDLVGELNQNFYENNPIGKWINENSNLKYDSAGAKAIQNAGEFVGKVALATAATVVSGGAAAPIVIGAMYGAGNAGEKYTQSVDRNNGESYNYGKALLRTTAGAVAGAAEFYGYGQMGAGMLGVNISPQASTSFVKNFLVKDTILDSASVITDHGVNVAFGDETLQQALLYGGGELALSLGMSAIGAYKTTKYSVRVEKNRDLAIEYYKKNKPNWMDDATFDNNLKNADKIAAKLEKEGLGKDKFYEIWGTPKGQRPAAESYLPKKYQKKVKKVFEKEGAARLVDGDTYRNYVASNGGIVGNPKEYSVGDLNFKSSEFMSTKSSIDTVVNNASNSTDFEASIVKDLGLTDYEYNIYKKSGIKRYDLSADNFKKANPRFPSGNEPGAFDMVWVPGAMTSGGSYEMIVDGFNLNDVGNRLTNIR